MRICLIGKYPPIQGGVSARNYWTARWLAARGHEVHVVTNGNEVEPEFRIGFLPGDEAWLAPRFERGSVRVWNTEAHGPRSRHIPDHNPFVSKLTSVALAAIEESRADVVVSVYFEPYALAGYLAASFTGVPLVLRHAGSDVGRLLAHPQLGPCYGQILRRADLVCGSVSTMERFAELGVPERRLQQDAGFALPQEVFHPGVPALEHPDPHLPTIGIYGKLGPAKGSFDLVAALGRLRAAGRAFRLWALCGGDMEQVERFWSAVRDAGLEDHTRLLPFMAHWRVPGFLRSLAAACFLEHHFPIAAHGPGIPQEVLAVAVPLVTTLEIARKQTFAASLVHGRSALVVRDPRDHAELAAALDVVVADPAAAAAIGREGHACLPPPRFERFVSRYEALLERARENRRSRRPERAERRRDTPRPGLKAGWSHFRWSRRVLGRAADRTAPRDTAASGAYEDALRLYEVWDAHWRSEGSRLPPYLGELLRWELHQVPDPGKVAAADALFFRKTPRAVETAVPARAPNVEVHVFRYDMESLAQAVETTDRPPKRWLEGDSCYVFQHLPGRTRNRVTRIGGPVHEFLDRVDGRSAVAAILRGMVARTEPASGTAPIEAVSRLFRDGILVVSGTAAHPPELEEDSHGQGTRGPGWQEVPAGRRSERRQEAEHPGRDQAGRGAAQGGRPAAEPSHRTRQADRPRRRQAQRRD